MKHLKLLEEFGTYELGSEEEVGRLIAKLNIDGNKEVVIDMTGCLPDYPATSKIIDEIIRQMRELTGQKKIVVQLGYFLPSETIVNWIFLGSKELKIEDEKELSLPEISKLIKENLVKSEIEISINNKKSGDIIDEIRFD